MSSYLYLVGSDMRMTNVAFGGGTGKGGGTPSFLFDFVLRSFDEYQDMGEYLSSKGDKICFENIVIPVPHRAGTWDAMYGSLRGRFGTMNFYDNFWLGIKEIINKIYDLPVAPPPSSKTKRWSKSDASRKPKVVWPWRPGGRSRDDGNRELLHRIMSEYFDFTILDGSDFKWHGPNSSARYQVSRAALKKIQSSDVMVGLFGANLWNSLHMLSGSILIELKSPYGYCGNENGRTLSNHNHLSFYAGDARSMAVNKQGVMYTEKFIRKLAEEIKEIYVWEVKNQPDSEPTGECEFNWPHRDYVNDSSGRILTKPDDRFCYLEKSDKGWFQMKDKGGWDNACEKMEGKFNEGYLEGDSMWCPEFCRE
ncbi:hypothetical protein TrST_g10722 [Triparma strigata]|uniref:Uncharacterized protein n=1 Tax=Triparma strigata TaxID=1606541 RepID=A0A9W7A680_9STRA|nr:hypothetical protein TrST_g10722 [Triparma strigata]